MPFQQEFYQGSDYVRKEGHNKDFPIGCRRPKLDEYMKKQIKNGLFLSKRDPCLFLQLLNMTDLLTCLWADNANQCFPPMGWLPHCIQHWQAVTFDQWVLQIVKGQLQAGADVNPNPELPVINHGDRGQQLAMLAVKTFTKSRENVLIRLGVQTTKQYYVFYVIHTGISNPYT